MKSTQVGEKIIEGKTKQVFRLKNHGQQDDFVYILSKDRITAGDGVKAHELKGKAKLSTQTNAAIFEFLNAAGVKTHFVSRLSLDSENSETAFVARDCAMIPIEWVTRRVATGSYLKRNPHVKEGYRFAPPKLETFFKDDANHDPYWSLETLAEAKLNCGGLIISQAHVEEMLTVTQLVFELLERVWATLDHSLIDMKIEFGVVQDKATGNKSIVVGDVIDNDSWRLWPSGDKRLMLDKQVYRNMDNAAIDDAALEKVRCNFQIVAERTHNLFSSVASWKVLASPVIALLLGSKSDESHANKVISALTDLGINREAIETHVCSAHKSTSYALKVVAQLTQWPSCKAIIAIAGRSNGLGPVTTANSPIPVINCPPYSDVTSMSLDIWSSLRMPSAMGCSTILGPENAALAAAQIVANSVPLVWSKIRAKQAYTVVKMIHDDAALSK